MKTATCLPLRKVAPFLPGGSVPPSRVSHVIPRTSMLQQRMATTDTEALTARIDTLETRLAFQEEIIEDLNKAIIEQWKQIEAMTRRLARLDERMEASELRADLAGLPEPPPPHY